MANFKKKITSKDIAQELGIIKIRCILRVKRQE